MIRLGSEDISVSFDSLNKWEGKVKDLIIPSIVDSIVDEAFWGNERLESLTIEEGVKEIGDYSFSYCENLKWVKIPASVNKIGMEAFSNCMSLEKIEVDPASKHFFSVEGVLFCRKPFTLIQYPRQKKETTYSIPSGVQTICSSAFCRCENLIHIEIPDTVTSIEDNAFSICSNLKTISIPDSVLEIGSCAFSDCNSLSKFRFPSKLSIIANNLLEGCEEIQNVEIPSHVTEIQDYSFIECKRLTRLSIPKSVETIYGNSFTRCSSLEWFDVDADNPNYTEIEGVIYTKDRSILVKVPPAYHKEHFIIPDDVQEIDEFAFDSCENICDIHIPNGVTRIGYYAFYGCIRLSKLKIPSSVNQIGTAHLVPFFPPELDDPFESDDLSTVFCSCDSLENIEVDKGNSLFSSHEGVLFSKDMSQILLFPAGRNQQEYTIPNGVECIGRHAFEDCIKLHSVIIPQSVKRIDNWAFSQCKGIEQIVIPSSVEDLSFNAFFESTIIHEGEK